MPAGEMVMKSMILLFGQGTSTTTASVIRMPTKAPTQAGATNQAFRVSIEVVLTVIGTRELDHGRGGAITRRLVAEKEKLNGNGAHRCPCSTVVVILDLQSNGDINSRLSEREDDRAVVLEENRATNAVADASTFIEPVRVACQARPATSEDVRAVSVDHLHGVRVFDVDHFVDHGQRHGLRTRVNQTIGSQHRVNATGHRPRHVRTDDESSEPAARREGEGELNIARHGHYDVRLAIGNVGGDAKICAICLRAWPVLPTEAVARDAVESAEIAD